jgi:protoheme ferro-lyase
MSLEEAFEYLLASWHRLPVDYKNKYKTYKSRYLNLSGKQTKKVSKDKMREMLHAANARESWLPPIFPDQIDRLKEKLGAGQMATDTENVLEVKIETRKKIYSLYNSSDQLVLRWSEKK